MPTVADDAIDHPSCKDQVPDAVATGAPASWARAPLTAKAVNVMAARTPAIQTLRRLGSVGIALILTHASRFVSPTESSGVAGRKVEEPACKPDPVRGAEAPPATICLGRMRRGACPRRSVRRTGAVYPAARAGRPRSLPVRPCSGWGLPAASVTRRAGALLPHRFTLTPHGRSRARRSALCCPVHEVTPAWLSPAPCPVESGLSSNGPKTARGRPADSSASEDTAEDLPYAATPRYRRAQPAIDARRSRADQPRCCAHAARVRTPHRRIRPPVHEPSGAAAAGAGS